MWNTEIPAEIYKAVVEGGWQVLVKEVPETSPVVEEVKMKGSFESGWIKPGNWDSNNW